MYIISKPLPGNCHILRAVGKRSEMASEDAARNPSKDGIDQVLKITIDGMDQAKFKCPRNIAASKAFEKLWRPQLHVIGAIAHGHLEVMAIMPPDAPKDANMNMTVLSIVMDLVLQYIGHSKAPSTFTIRPLLELRVVPF